MPTVYTKHAVDKLKTSESRKFKITKKKIESILKAPIAQQILPTGLIRSVGALKKEYSLCVVYKFEDDIIRVITFFPTEKGRYESKILS